MRLQLYGLKNCDTCKKAMKWLEAEDIPFEFVDIRDNTPEVATITGWLADVENPCLSLSIQQIATTKKGAREAALSLFLINAT